MKKNYKLLATLVLSGLAGAAFGVLPAEAAVTVGSADGTEKSLTNTEFTSLYGNQYMDSTSGNTVSISGEGTVTLKGETVSPDGLSTASTLAGAYALESGDASNNKLSVTDGASVSFSNATDNWIAGRIAGGISMKGAASGNQVTLSGVSLNLPDATTSSLKIAGGVSGASASASASGNTVTLSNSTAQSSYIYGGYGGYGYMEYYGDTSAEADAVAGVNHNTVTLTNSTAQSLDIYGGYIKYYGDTSAEADAVAGVNHNTVTLTNTSASGTRVYGGYVAAAPPIPTVLNVSSNTMEISNTAEKKYGVSTEESTETDTSTEADPISTSASSNSVTITGSQVEGVYGGVGQIGSAKGNIVTITDSSVEMEAVGGETGYMMNWRITQPGQLKDAENNQVIVNGSSTIGTVVGGEAAAANTFDNEDKEYNGVQTSGKSSGNTVTINDGTVKNSVLGGYSAMSDAIGNTVNIAGGIIGTESSGTGEADDNAIAGGFAEEGQANNNTVNITGGTLGAMMSLYGGYSEKGSSSNTLNLHTKGNTVKNLGYFQNLNFYVPEGTAAGETMVTVTGNADVSKAVIQAGIEKTTKLAPGQAINLIYDAGGIKTDGTSYSMMSGKDIVSDAGFVDRKAAVKKQDDSTIVVYVPKDEKGTIHPDTKIIPEDRENGINTIKNAGDLVSNAAEGAWKEDHDVDAKFVPYAIVGGYDLHYNTGSYIDSNGMAANVGLIRRIRRDGAIDTVMPFLEYGRSNYASFLDDGARGDGRQHYTGGGVLLRRDLDDGKYYEGAIRAGRLKGDFHGIIDSTALRYDSSAPYVAAQAGAGKIYAKDRDTYDLYGKFFWTHLGSDTATIRNSRGEAKYEFDDINSYRTRLGMRWTRNFDKVRSLYAGIGWDYEFDSKARAFYDAYRTDTPTVKGSSEFLELGWKSKVTSDHPWGVDLKATGWTGKQEGGTLFATVSRSF